MFDCPHCKSVTDRLIMTGGEGIKCPNCFTNAPRLSGANYHNKAGLKGKARNLTEVGKKHIWTRGIGSDGKTVVNKNTGKKWSW